MTATQRKPRDHTCRLNAAPRTIASLEYPATFPSQDVMKISIEYCTL